MYVNIIYTRIYICMYIYTRIHIHRFLGAHTHTHIRICIYKRAFQSHARGANTFMNESCYTYEAHIALMQSCHTYTRHFALIHA